MRSFFMITNMRLRPTLSFHSNDFRSLISGWSAATTHSFDHSFPRASHQLRGQSNRIPAGRLSKGLFTSLSHTPTHTHTHPHVHAHIPLQNYEQPTQLASPLFLFLFQYGPVFSFTMVGKTFTYLIGSDAAATFFNSKNEDLNAEEVYGKLVTPVFGKGVAYDVPNNVRKGPLFTCRIQHSSRFYTSASCVGFG